MLSQEEALDRILSTVTPLPSQRVPLEEALERFAAESLRARISLPSFDNSAMDGYAVRAADTKSTAPIQVVAEQAAGVSHHFTLPENSAIRIFTGAPMPDGADAVIMQEDVSLVNGGEQISCIEPVEVEENVRLTGCDLCIGQRIIESGDKLTAGRLALLASQGLRDISITDQPRVVIITTGDELVAAGASLQEGQIYNSNGIMLQSLIRETGCGDVTRLHLKDDLKQTTEALRQCLAEFDVIILSGGVSVGDHDYVKPALQALGIAPDFWRVAVKPGKPLLFLESQKADESASYLFGLPGNPVSSYVTFLLFVRPALLKLMGAGHTHLHLRNVQAMLAVAQSNKGDRPHYLRGYYLDGIFTPQGMQQSHALFALSQTNALLRLEAGQNLEAGMTANVLLLP